MAPSKHQVETAYVQKQVSPGSKQSCIGAAPGMPGVGGGFARTPCLRRKRQYLFERVCIEIYEAVMTPEEWPFTEGCFYGRNEIWRCELVVIEGHNVRGIRRPNADVSTERNIEFTERIFIGRKSHQPNCKSKCRQRFFVEFVANQRNQIR